MASSLDQPDQPAVVDKFNEKNDTDFEASWLLCAKCKYWLTSPIFMHQDEKYYCTTCSINLGGGMRAKPLEKLFEKCQYPCINMECPSWFSFKHIQKHKGTCKFNSFICNFCTDQCLEKEYLDHLMEKHSKLCTNLKFSNSSLQIEWKNNAEIDEKIFIAEYASQHILIHAKSDKNHLYISLASTHFDATLQTNIGHQYELEDHSDGIFGRIRLGKFISVQQLGNLKQYDGIILDNGWKCLSIEVRFENLGNLLKVADCPICMHPMKDSIVLCENGHPVCNSCAAMIEKCAVCRMTMSKVTLRMSDVLQKMQKLADDQYPTSTSSKLVDNNKLQSVETCNAMTNCPECNVAMAMNILCVHYSNQHVVKPFGYKYSIHISGKDCQVCDGHLFCLKRIWNGDNHRGGDGLLYVHILTSNDPNVAKRYRYKLTKLGAFREGRILENTILEGPCQIQSELVITSRLTYDILKNCHIFYFDIIKVAH